jgi:hypothetical protein
VKDSEASAGDEWNSTPALLFPFPEIDALSVTSHTSRSLDLISVDHAIVVGVEPIEDTVTTLPLLAGNLTIAVLIHGLE